MLIRYNTNTGRLAVYQNAKAAGDQMPVYRTQDELYKSPATTAELTYFYNSLTGAQLKSFKTKGDGVKRIFKHLENGYNGELSDAERVNPDGDELGAPADAGPDALAADREVSAQGRGTAGEGGKASRRGSKATLGDGEEAGEAAEHDSEAADASDLDEGSDLAENGETHGRGSNAGGEASPRGKRGRKPGTTLAGKRVAVAVAVNPRRPSSSRFRSFELIREAGEDGIAVEDYCAAGGSLGDLKANLDKGLVKTI